MSSSYLSTEFAAAKPPTLLQIINITMLFITTRELLLVLLAAVCCGSAAAITTAENEDVAPTIIRKRNQPSDFSSSASLSSAASSAHLRGGGSGVNDKTVDPFVDIPRKLISDYKARALSMSMSMSMGNYLSFDDDFTFFQTDDAPWCVGITKKKTGKECAYDCECRSDCCRYDGSDKVCIKIGRGKPTCPD